MASGSDDKYSLEDELDEFLAQDISRYVELSKLKTFANELKVPRRELDRMNVPTEEERVKKVSKISLCQKSFHTMEQSHYYWPI